MYLGAVKDTMRSLGLCAKTIELGKSQILDQNSHIIDYNDSHTYLDTIVKIDFETYDAK